VFSATGLASLLLARLAGRRLADSPVEFFLFRGYAERFRNFHTRPRLNDSRFGDPCFRIGLRILDGQAELDGAAIRATIPFDRPHLIAMRLALRAQPRLVIEPDGF